MGKIFVTEIPLYKKLLCFLVVNLILGSLLYHSWYTKTYPDYKQVRETAEEMIAIDWSRVEKVACAAPHSRNICHLFDSAEDISALCSVLQTMRVKEPFLDSGGLTGGAYYRLSFFMKDGTITEFTVGTYDYDRKKDIYTVYLIQPDPPINDRGDKVYAGIEVDGLHELLSIDSVYRISREEYERIVSE